ncbi:MAG: LamG-like jellyroll fold domain-containing protein [Bacteroidota bacterium]
MKKHYLSTLVFLLLSFLALTAQTPFAWYPLDGNAIDVSGAARNGTMSGSPIATDNRLGETDKAILFDGTTDYITLPSAFDFPERSVMLWFNASRIGSANGYNNIFSSDGPHLQNGLTNLTVYTDSSLGNTMTLRTGNALLISPVDTGRWYHIAVTRTTAFAKFYINGVLVQTVASPGNLTSNNGILTTALIGADRGYNAKFFGSIDDVRVFNSELDSTEVLSAFNSTIDSFVQITGRLYFDANQNQTYDAGEQPVRNQIVNVGSNYLALTNTTGNYTAYTTPGTYTITPSLTGDIAAFPYSPDSIVVNADSSGVTYPGNDFGLIAPANFCQGSLSIVAFTPPARPGFTNRANVRFVNAFSATAVSQTIRFNYPPQQQYVSATPTPTSIDTLNHTLVWDITNVGSGTLWQAMVTLYSAPTVAIGSIFEMSALVSNSTCASLDSLQISEQLIVVGSFDPNDKAVSPVGVGPTGRILPSTPLLSYTIRFQNTGTYLAENVNVIDTISALLDISTLRVLAASHGYEVLINGREVTFRFSQIMLPDSNANEPMSHGFIKYSIEPTSGFVQNSVIENRADIYFDFNEPILTNTTQSTADISIGILKAEVNEIGFSIYPNPLSSGNWQLVTDEEMTGKQLRIFDAAGRNVYTSRITGRQTEIDASALQQGVYILRIENSAARIIKL